MSRGGSIPVSGEATIGNPNDSDLSGHDVPLLGRTLFTNKRRIADALFCDI